MKKGAVEPEPKKRRASYINLNAAKTDQNVKSENQDCQIIVAPLHDADRNAFFAVFDGHGLAGKFCAEFCMHR